MSLLKRLAAKLPDTWQNELKRHYFSYQIHRNRFVTDELEFALLENIIKPGDYVIDIGANVGHYTKRFSELVGIDGRIISFEPVPETFALLAANVQLFKYKNVTLINAAVSDCTQSVSMSIPTFNTGLKNYYEARLSDASDQLRVLSFRIDTLSLSHRIALIKIDVEGHEEFVLQGMRALLDRDHPILIIETASRMIEKSLNIMGYESERLEGSPNVIFRASL